MEKPRSLLTQINKYKGEQPLFIEAKADTLNQQQIKFLQFIEHGDKSKFEIKKSPKKLETLKSIDAKIFWVR